MKGKSCGQKGEKSDLDHCVVENRSLSLAGWCISVLELATNSCVTGGNSDTAGKNTTSLHDNGGSDPGKSAINESGGSTASKLVGVGVNM